jgi:hypothetical protein
MRTLRQLIFVKHWTPKERDGRLIGFVLLVDLFFWSVCMNVIYGGYCLAERLIPTSNLLIGPGVIHHLW